MQARKDPAKSPKPVTKPEPVQTPQKAPKDLGAAEAKAKQDEEQLSHTSDA